MSWQDSLAAAGLRLNIPHMDHQCFPCLVATDFSQTHWKLQRYGGNTASLWLGGKKQQKNEAKNIGGTFLWVRRRNGQNWFTTNKLRSFVGYFEGFGLGEKKKVFPTARNYVLSLVGGRNI